MLAVLLRLFWLWFYVSFGLAGLVLAALGAALARDALRAALGRERHPEAHTDGVPG